MISILVSLFSPQIVSVMSLLMMGMLVVLAVGKEKSRVTIEPANNVTSKKIKSQVGKILVTGGTGYIGSHTIVELLDEGYEVVILDSLVNSTVRSIQRVEKITGKGAFLSFHKVDLCDLNALDSFFGKHQSFDFVIHFAALKAVGESVVKPMEYYRNNIMGTLNLIEVMKKYNCHNIIFSSSASVYGSQKAPFGEESQAGIGIMSPYGKTKYMMEEILRDLYNSPDGKKWKIVILRYFNPVGAHPSGLIGEDPTGIPNNLMPYISQVCVGRRPFLTVFGNDYNTIDGSCIRDYIHVVDLAKGHLAALTYARSRDSLCGLYNLGTGSGVSVLELVAGMEKASGKKIPVRIGERRAGDLETMYAVPDLALKELGWKAEKTVEDMCNDTWKWQSMNPKGYES